jgi:hypothetical protein
MKKTKVLSFLLLAFAPLSQAAKGLGAPDNSWHLPQYLAMAEKRPEKLLELAESFFEKDRMERARKDAALAEDWRERSALVISLGSLWTSKSAAARAKAHQAGAQKILREALMNDPALLVRDATAESVGEILRSRPDLAKAWSATLEEAFLHEKNMVQGEGLFIRETLLTVMYDAGIRPSKKVLKSAKQDLNPQVRSLLDQWNTANFQPLSF